jgi:uracil-DNA glycosylase
MNTDWQNETIQPTLLFSRNHDVDKINSTNLNSISAEQRYYLSSTVFEPKRWYEEQNSGEPPTKDSDSATFAISKLKQDATFADNLELRLGAQVMLITNMDTSIGLVNGSRGVVVAFEPVRGFPTVKFKNGLTRLIEPFIWWSHEFPHIGQQQIPLRVAYAITIHKSQGASIDSAIVDIGRNTFEYGQAYVALSRVRSLEGLHLFSLDISRIRTHPRVSSFYKNLTKGLEPLMKTVEAVKAVGAVKAVAVETVEAVNTKGTIHSFFAKKVPVATAFTATASASAKPSSAWDFTDVDSTWLDVLKKSLSDNGSLETFVSDARVSGHVYPNKMDVFRALKLSLDKVKVVILGQDPYHGSGQAMGLSFSVPDGVSCPPSLKNIFKELKADLGIEKTTGNLQSWADQGVLLLNTILTVECGKPLSHANQGWESVTDALLKTLVAKRSGVVFMLWGKTAQKKIPLLGSKQIILESAHPSPLSAHNGFFGCKHFSKANAELGLANAISW